MLNITYLKLSGVVLLAQFVVHIKPLIGIGLMCAGGNSSGVCGG